jgi:hypothetical protein
MIAAAMLIYAVFPIAHSADASLSFRTFNRILSRPYFPLQITLGVMTGYIVRARLRTPFTFWVWIIPTIFLGFCVLTFTTSVFESLCVEAQEVVQIETGTADGWSVVQTSMRAVPIVLMDPVRQLDGTLI